MKQSDRQQGFTLIELSIVLVIIGLIVGGVLVGQDLIRSAETRATITQIEKYNTAVNTFRGKFNALPGDITLDAATTFGFTAHTVNATLPGQGDGNGLLDGEAGYNSYAQGGGETGMFWEDLSSSAAGNLIDGTFNAANNHTTPNATSTTIALYMPPAKLSGGRYIYVYEYNGYNWYGISGVIGLAGGFFTSSNSTPTIPIIQAYNIDKKTDDGFPTSGNVVAYYVNSIGGPFTPPTQSPNTQPSATAAATDCYSTDATPVYDTNKNNGNGANCGISIKFQ